MVVIWIFYTLIDVNRCLNNCFSCSVRVYIVSVVPTVKILISSKEGEFEQRRFLISKRICYLIECLLDRASL